MHLLFPEVAGGRLEDGLAAADEGGSSEAVADSEARDGEVEDGIAGAVEHRQSVVIGVGGKGITVAGGQDVTAEGIVVMRKTQLAKEGGREVGLVAQHIDAAGTAHGTAKP